MPFANLLLIETFLREQSK
uniref:Uncharacterized protein n=1 Tax=Arundo donax TaxID=35708 RepID=A0A0A8Z5L9_ARUDO